MGSRLAGQCKVWDRLRLTIYLLCAALSLFSWQPALAQVAATVAIDLHDGFTGSRSYVFPSGTRLDVAIGRPEVIELVEYAGEWKNGKAEGKGILSANIRQLAADNPIARKLASTNQYEREEAAALVERVRQEAKLLGNDPDQAEKELLQSGKASALRLTGEFRNGVAEGDGVFEWGTGRSAAVHLSKWKPVGPAVILYETMPVAMFSLEWQGANLHIADGPFTVLERAPAGQISAVFAGAVKAGQATGAWQDLPWTIEMGGTRVSVAGGTKIVQEAGTIMRCPWPGSPRRDPLSFIRSPGPTGSFLMDDLSTASTSYVAPTGTASCHANFAGWTFDLGVATAVSGYELVGPNSCRSPTGYTGTVKRYANGGVYCETIEPQDDWIDKLWAAVVKPIRQAVKPITSAADSIGKSVSSSMCQAFGYEEGRNCSVNTNGAIQIVQISLEEKRTDANLPANAARVLKTTAAARERDPGAKVEALGQLSRLLGECVYACPAAFLPFAEASSQELFDAMKPGLDQDARDHRLAGLTGQLITVMAAIGTGLTAMKLHDTWALTADTSTLFQSKVDYLDQLALKYPARKDEIWIVQSKFTGLNTVGASMLLSASLESANIVKDWAKDKGLELILPDSELLALLRAAHDNVQAVEQLLDQHRAAKTSQEFWKAYFDKEMKGLPTL